MGRGGTQFYSPWPSVANGFQKIGSAVAVLDIGAVHHEANYQPERIDNDMALAPFDKRVATMRGFVRASS